VWLASRRVGRDCPNRVTAAMRRSAGHVTVLGSVVATATDDGWRVTAYSADGSGQGGAVARVVKENTAGHAAVDVEDRASKRHRNTRTAGQLSAEPADTGEPSSSAVDIAIASTAVHSAGSSAVQPPAASSTAGSIVSLAKRKAEDDSASEVVSVPMKVHPLGSPILMRTTRLDRFANDYGAVRRWCVATSPHSHPPTPVLVPQQIGWLTSMTITSLDVFCKSCKVQMQRSSATCKCSVVVRCSAS
jgi:hypothetical protein